MKISKANVKSAAVTLLVALLAHIGLDKGLDWTSEKGDMAEKISAATALLVGLGLATFSKSDIAKAVGILATGKGGHRLINSFVTDSSGSLKTDPVSQAVGNLTVPGGSGLGSLRGFMKGIGLGNMPTQSYVDPTGQLMTGLPATSNYGAGMLST